MASIPIHNETDYLLTNDMTQHILRDAQEHFGEEVHAIRVQSGLERHAFNARTREVRYAFSPQDFGFGQTLPIAPEPRTPEPPRARRRSSRSDAEPEAALIPAPFEDIEEEEEDMEPIETSLESLDEGQDDEEEDDVFTLDAPVEDADEDEEDNVLDDEEDNVFEDDEV
jgi:hypothetical protein